MKPSSLQKKPTRNIEPSPFQQQSSFINKANDPASLDHYRSVPSLFM
jgi:hypothetical protein